MCASRISTAMTYLDITNSLLSGGTILVLTALVALGPVAVITLTSFLKIMIVIKIVRNATGLMDVPPNMAIHAISLILTVYVMAPVAFDIGQILNRPEVDLNDLTRVESTESLLETVEPIRAFLIKHSTDRHKAFFSGAARSMWADERGVEITDHHMLVLVPAFTVTQLASAFETGFLLYLPFLVIDLVVSNILMALGMIMVSPMMVSLPLKLLLFVLADGWSRLLHGLVLSYQ